MGAVRVIGWLRIRRIPLQETLSVVLIIIFGSPHPVES
jgi:hypothetical protein